MRFPSLKFFHHCGRLKSSMIRSSQERDRQSQQWRRIAKRLRRQMMSEVDGFSGY